MCTKSAGSDIAMYWQYTIECTLEATVLQEAHAASEGAGWSGADLPVRREADGPTGSESAAESHPAAP